MRNKTIEILRNENVGDSLGKHNYNILSLDSTICNVSSFLVDNFYTLQDVNSSVDLFVNSSSLVNNPRKLNDAFLTVSYLSSYWAQNEFSVFYPFNVAVLGSVIVDGYTTDISIETIKSVATTYLVNNFPPSQFAESTRSNVIIPLYTRLPSLSSVYTLLDEDTSPTLTEEIQADNRFLTTPLETVKDWRITELQKYSNKQLLEKGFTLEELFYLRNILLKSPTALQPEYNVYLKFKSVWVDGLIVPLLNALKSNNPLFTIENVKNIVHVSVESLQQQTYGGFSFAAAQLLTGLTSKYFYDVISGQEYVTKFCQGLLSNGSTTSLSISSIPYDRSLNRLTNLEIDSINIQSVFPITRSLCRFVAINNQWICYDVIL